MEYDPFTKQPINPPPPPPPPPPTSPVAGSLTVSDVSTAEGNSGTHSATFTVTRSGGTLAFDVSYATADGSASSVSDYLAQSDTLHFAEGVNSQTISVAVVGDSAVEGNETFAVNLSNGTNGVMIADGHGVGTIVDDDSSAPPPPPSDPQPPYTGGPYALHFVNGGANFVMPTQWVVSDPSDPTYLPPRYHGLNADDKYVPDGFDGNHDGLGTVQPKATSDYTWIFFSENYYFVA